MTTQSDTLSRGHLMLWGLVDVAARWPAATAPLGLVFLAAEMTGGFASGPVLAGAFVAGEVVGAALQARWLVGGSTRRRLAASLALTAIPFALLGTVPRPPVWMLALLAAITGGIPATAPGILRAMLVAGVPQDRVVHALSVETDLTYSIWSVSPALVAGTSVTLSSRVPMLLCVGFALAAAGGAVMLPDPAPAQVRTGPGARVLAAGWPAYVTSAIAISLAALTELMISPLLQQRGLPLGWAGVLLGGYSFAAILGSFLYGSRTWPGSIAAQSAVLLAAIAVCVTAAGLIPALPGIAIALLAAGVLQAALLTVRNLALARLLPRYAHAAGYSVMYGAIGVGYLVSAGTESVALHHVSPSTAMVIGVVASTLATVAALGAERRSTAAKALGKPAERVVDAGIA